MGAEERASHNWLAIDAAHANEVRFALVQPGTRPFPSDVKRYPISQFATFTDSILRFAQDTGLNLRGVSCALAIAGAATGDSIPLARSRWTISRSGLASMLQHQPLIINEVAAQAWATSYGLAGAAAVRGSAVSALPRPGRYVYVGVLEGIGAAIIDFTATTLRVSETEAGHMDYAPATSADEKIAKSWYPQSWPSWEQMLFHEPSGVGSEPLAADAIAVMRAGLLGRMLSNMVLATGAWNGVVLIGNRVKPLLDARGARSAFETGFTGRSAFRRLLASAPVWHVTHPEAVISGLAALIAHEGS